MNISRGIIFFFILFTNSYSIAQKSDTSLSLSGLINIKDSLYSKNINTVLLYFNQIKNPEALYELSDFLNQSPNIHSLHLILNDVANNKVEIQNLQLDKCKNITDLRVESSREKIYDVLWPSITKIKNLKSLELILLNGTIPNSISKLKNLKSLFLYGANITKIPNSICALEHLEILKIHDSDLSSIPLEINKLKNLRTLSIKHCPLSEVPNLSGLNNIEIIDFDNKYDIESDDNLYRELISQIEYNLDSLKRLNISQYKFSNELFELLLSKLTESDDMKLELHLENCGISSLPKPYWDSIYLKELDLSGNKINRLPKEFFKAKIDKIDLAGNDMWPVLFNSLHSFKMTGYGLGYLSIEEVQDYIDLTEPKQIGYEDERFYELLNIAQKQNNVSIVDSLNPRIAAKYYYLKNEYDKSVFYYSKILNRFYKEKILYNPYGRYAIEDDWQKYMIAAIKTGNIENLKNALLDLNYVIEQHELIINSNNQYCNYIKAFLYEVATIALLYKKVQLNEESEFFYSKAIEKVKQSKEYSELDTYDLFLLLELHLVFYKNLEYQKVLNFIKSNVILSEAENVKLSYLIFVKKLLSFPNKNFESEIRNYEPIPSISQNQFFQTELLGFFALLNDEQNLQRLNKHLDIMLKNQLTID